ncbi:RNA-directed DNA polymerase, eukaryota, reverse transcriptase zinc-binding domain protein [Tanacetum coccineum]
MGAENARTALKIFCKCVIEFFVAEYFRKPTVTDVEKLCTFHEQKHGFSGMLRSLDCTDWEWFGRPTAYKGQSCRRDHGLNPFILLEVIDHNDIIDRTCFLLQAKNWALIGKWWWRFLLEKDALWSKVIRSIHGRDRGLGVGNSFVESRSSVWADIIKVGCDIDKTGVEFSMSLSGRDSWSWSLGDKGIFSVKELSNIIDDKCLHLDGLVQETRWNKLVSKKVNVFVWRVFLGRLSVRVELDKRGIDMDYLLCPHCEDGVESIDHAFILCNMASSVWSKVFNWWKLGHVNAFTTKDILNHVGGSQFSSQNKLK